MSTIDAFLRGINHGLNPRAANDYYRQKAVDEQRTYDEAQITKSNEYLAKQWGHKAYTPLEEGMEPIEGTGYLGGKLSDEEMISAYSQGLIGDTRKTGRNMLEKLMQNRLSTRLAKIPKSTAAQSDYLYGNEDDEFRSYQERMANLRRQNINISTGGAAPVGHIANDQEKKALDMSLDDAVWIKPDGEPKVIGGRNKDEVSAGIVSKSLMDRMETMESSIGGYTPTIIDNLDQFGVPESIANMFRSPQGQVHTATYKSIVADVVKEISGAAATDAEKADLRTQLAYSPSDSNLSLANKMYLVMKRIDDINAKAGRGASEYTDVVSKFRLRLTGAAEANKRKSTKPETKWDPSTGPRPGMTWAE